MTAEAETVRSLRYWAFAAYDRPGVRDACLELQDGHDMDVVVLLWCIWAGEHHGPLDTEAMRRIVADASTWQADVVGPLRTVRRRLRQDDGSPAPSEDTEAAAARSRLRRQVADAELAAEAIQLDYLEAATAAAVAASSIVGPAGTAAVQANLARLVEIAGSGGDPARDEIIAALAARAVDGSA